MRSALPGFASPLGAGSIKSGRWSSGAACLRWTAGVRFGYRVQGSGFSPLSCNTWLYCNVVVGAVSDNGRYFSLHGYANEGKGASRGSNRVAKCL